MATPQAGSPQQGMLGPHPEMRALRRLRVQWVFVVLASAAALAAGWTVVADLWNPGQANHWLLLAGAATTIQMAILYASLPANRNRSDSELYPTLGAANTLTLARGLSTCLLAGFLFAPLPAGPLAWAPALLYGAERFIDFFDGYVARRSGRETRLGAILDIEFDGIGILVAVTLAVQYGLLPGWYLLLGLSRPLFVAGMALLRARGRTVYPLARSDHRRIIAGLQTGFMAVLLWPIWEPAAARLAGTLFALPLLFSFGRDWLVVSGAVDADSPRYLWWRARARTLLTGWLPLVARLAGAGAVAFILARELSMPAGFTLPTLLGWGVVSVAGLALLLGFVGRAAALLLLVAAGLDATGAGLRWQDNALLLAAAATVLHLGTGLLALWKPEERLIRIQAGSRKDEAA